MAGAIQKLPRLCLECNFSVGKENAYYVRSYGREAPYAVRFSYKVLKHFEKKGNLATLKQFLS